MHPKTDEHAHIASHGIFVRKNYRNLGLGITLAKELIEIAKKQGLEILQLSIYSTNKELSTSTKNVASKMMED